MMPLSIGETLNHDDAELEIQTQQFHLASLMAQLIDDMMPFAASHDVNLSIELSPRALNTFAGDPSNLARAAICILRHTIGRVPGGRVKAKVLIDEAGQAMRFEVCDNGPAYLESEVAIFSLSPHVSPSTDQTGTDIFRLNLPIACRIATYLGGTLSLKGGALAGGLIRLDLPLALADLQIRPPAKLETSLTPLSILCVDQDRPSQQALKAILETLGYDPDLAFSHTAGEEAAQIRAYDLILVAPPPNKLAARADSSVLDLVAAVSVSQRAAHPLVALMLEDDTSQDQAERRFGQMATLRKPINLVALLNLLNSCAQSYFRDEVTGNAALDPAA